jgi:hypothetical protein
MTFTAADEYLVHQTPYTFDRVATSDRNFYDRYFFNGYSRDGALFFAVAMGQYPNLGITDAAFNVVVDGKQRVVRASRRLGNDRMHTEVGPVRVEIERPLHRVRVTVAPNEWGISGDLVFEARSLPVEEPHFLRLAGSVPVMDYTRMTQHGAWSGQLLIDGRSIDVEAANWWGSRDHSWGIRNVGGRDPRGAPSTAAPQFFWNWAPLNFDDLCTLYTVSEHADGTRWHESAVLLTPHPGATATHAAPEHDLRFKKGTRWLESATITLTPEGGPPLAIEFEPLYAFLMKGLGYGDPKWGHGMWVGEHVVDGTEFDLAAEEPMANLHVQQVCRVSAGQRQGIGVFEIIVAGQYARYGFKEMMDPA